ncbi:MAG: molybdopterin-guanine dinucleotide biosynthesis protein B [Magnetococcales bacterium]|nr:molybdopterin-guanine dinucleotide biosynthesis protein B [Magnetococcales bacterium]MBF0438391.1 molybdopterin-guanine dinucleotide biosynthesis protein B [Magnetococcales bacterium]
MNTPPIIGFVAPSGSGKTTLMEQVITHLVRSGLVVAAIKHGHHPADPDIPGKDTHRFREAGAETVLFACRQRWFMIQDLHNRPEPTLAEQVQRLTGHDLILVEGYKDEQHPKIVIHRREAGEHDLHHRLQQVVAVATDDPNLPTELPLLPLNNPEAVATFIRHHIGFSTENKPIR